MAEKSLLLRIKANVDDAKKGIGEVGRGLADMMAGKTGGMDKFASGVATTFHKLHDVMDDISPVAEKILGLAKGAIDTMQFAAQRQELMGRVSADTLAKMKVATLGVVGETRLMEVAAKSATGQFALTRSELEMVSRAALVLAKQTLKPVDEALQDITESLRTGTVKGLKEYGISIDKSKSKAEAFQEALGELSKVAYGSGAAVADAGDKIDAAMTHVSNAGSGIKEFIGNALLGLVDVLDMLSDGTTGTAQGLEDAAVGAGKLGTKFAELRDEYIRMRDAGVQWGYTQGGFAGVGIQQNINLGTHALEKQRDELTEYNRVLNASKDAAKAAAAAELWLGLERAKAIRMANERAQDEQRKRFEAYGEDIRERKRAAEEWAREHEKAIAKAHDFKIALMEFETGMMSLPSKFNGAFSGAASAFGGWVDEITAKNAEAQAAFHESWQSIIDAPGELAARLTGAVGKGWAQLEAVSERSLTTAERYRDTLKSIGKDALGGLKDSAAAAFTAVISGQEGAAEAARALFNQTATGLANELWGLAFKATVEGLLGNPAAFAAAGIATAGALFMTGIAGATAPSSPPGGGGASAPAPRANNDSVGQGATSSVTQVTNNYNLGYGFVGSPGELSRELEKRRQDGLLSGAVRPARGVERR